MWPAGCELAHSGVAARRLHGARGVPIVRRAEMLAEYFTHDGGDTSVWRLKGHARHIFWQWVGQWGAMVRRPSDLGFDDSAYALPPLHLHEHSVETEMPLNGMLFAAEARHVMLECGPRLAKAFLAADVVDRIVWFAAPILLGSFGLAVVEGGPATLADAARWRVTATQPCGPDVRIDLLKER